MLAPMLVLSVETRRTDREWTATALDVLVPYAGASGAAAARYGKAAAVAASASR